MAHIFVKPAVRHAWLLLNIIFSPPLQLLGDGLKMNQMFETVSNGKFEGNHTKTWPFPDKTTGVLPQGVSGMLWNLNNKRIKKVLFQAPLGT
jgi:hypothetical protein